jgi:predicted enzyme related to lactoylglutathione lyase
MALAWDGGLTCSIGVSDLERALAWYRDTLGFKHLYTAAEIGWCELETGVARVNVGLSQQEKAGGPGGATLTFGVKDIAVAETALKAKGVKFDGPVRVIPDLVKLLTFYDPDGNTLMLYEALNES